MSVLLKGLLGRNPHFLVLLSDSAWVKREPRQTGHSLGQAPPWIDGATIRAGPPERLKPSFGQVSQADINYQNKEIHTSALSLTSHYKTVILIDSV